MSTLPRFPNIPELESGQILGATYLNALARGCEHLLGISHAAYALPYATAVLQRYESTYGDMATYYMYHASDLVGYAFIGGNTSAGKTWYIHLDYYGDDHAWHTVGSWSGTDSPSVQSGALDLSAEANITIGNIYKWRWQGKTSNKTYYTTLQVTTLCTRPTLTGWVAPPTISAGASSHASLNTYRDDLVALNAQMVSPTNVVSMGVEGKKHTHTEGDWVAYTRYAYRYRPNGLTVGLFGKIGGGHWGWRVKFADSAGNEATIYSVSDIDPTPEYTYQSANLDLTTGAVAAALAAAGITLTFGRGYLITIEAKRQSDDHALYLQHPLCLRTSNGAPGGSWADNKLWAHLDTDVGPTQLNKVRTDLLELYTGGTEELWGENHACYYEDGSSPSGAVVHLKRYLVYRWPTDGDTPRILYGANFAEEYSLPSGDGWLSFDLAGLGIPWGGAYIVSNPGGAFEMDEPYDG